MTRGFTLIELVVTLAVLAVLETAVVPVAKVVTQRGREQHLRTALNEIRSAIDGFKRASDEGRILKLVNSSGYPPTLDVLVDGVEDVRDPKKSKIKFIRRIPRDPFHADPSVPDALTWGRRSYASEANDPQEGDDVYDIYSRATGAGLNGIAYRRW